MPLMTDGDLALDINSGGIGERYYKLSAYEVY